MKNKSILKAGANADAEEEKIKSLGVAMIAIRGGGGSGVRGEIKTRDPLAVILAFYPRSHVRPNAEETARNR